MPAVFRTPAAQRGIEELRGPRRRRYDEWERLLQAAGCAAMDYRLAGDPPLSELCCVHLQRQDRAVVCFQPDRVVVVVVGQHREQDAAANVYDLLYALAGLEMPPLAARTKPSCCDAAGGDPYIDEHAVGALLDRVRRVLLR